jgi:hypothetical protein
VPSLSHIESLINEMHTTRIPNLKFQHDSNISDTLKNLARDFEERTKRIVK